MLPTGGVADAAGDIGVGAFADAVVTTDTALAATVAGGGMLRSDLTLGVDLMMVDVWVEDEEATVARISASVMSTVVLASCAMRTCSRKLYLFLNCFEQCSQSRGGCGVCWVRMCRHRFTVVMTTLQNWHCDHLFSGPT